MAAMFKKRFSSSPTFEGQESIDPGTTSFGKLLDQLSKVLDDTQRREALQIKGLPFGGWPKRVGGVLDSITQRLVREQGEVAADDAAGEGGFSSQLFPPCLQALVSSGALVRLRTACSPDQPKGSRRVFLKFFAALLNETKQSLILQQEVLIPLERYLEGSTRARLPAAEAGHHIAILSHVVKKFVGDPSLLALFFGARDGSPSFPVFEALVPYMHHTDEAGARARDSLLLCMQLSSTNPEVAAFMVQRSNFCQTLATGLSGLYSALPSCLPAGVKGAWRLHGLDITVSMPQLALFLRSLDFCGAVVAAAPRPLGKAVLRLVHDGFLIPVMCPALHQRLPAEATAATAYFEVCIRSITQPLLMRAFLRFLLSSAYEPHGISTPRATIDVLTERLGGQGELCLVALRLFQTLIDLHCEDVLYELVLRHLIHGQHLKDPETASRPLQPVQQAKRDSERVRCIAPRAFLGLRPRMTADSPGGCTFRACLIDARRGIDQCARACRCWSSDYATIQHGADGSGGDSGGGDAGDGADGGASTASASSSSSPSSFFRSSQGKVGGLFGNLKQSILKKKEAAAVRAPPFLEALFGKVEKMLTQSVQVNVLVTGLVASLARHPHPVLSEYLLNPSLVLKSGYPSLYGKLHHIAKQAEVYTAKADSFDTQLQDARNSVPPPKAGPPLANPTPASVVLARQGLAAPTASSGSGNGSDSGVSSITSPNESPRMIRKMLNSLRGGGGGGGGGGSGGGGGGSGGGGGARPTSPADEGTHGGEPILPPTGSDHDEVVRRARGHAAGQREFDSESNASSSSAGTVGSIKDNPTRMRAKKRLVLSVLIFEEFLKELAALCMEQNLRGD